MKLELALPIEDYRQALAPPARGCGGFVLDSRTSEGDFTLLGAEPFLAFRAFRSARRLASGALGARVVVETRDGIEHAEVDDRGSLPAGKLKARGHTRNRTNPPVVVPPGPLPRERRVVSCTTTSTPDEQRRRQRAEMTEVNV